jgi:hypothetical protein
MKNLIIVFTISLAAISCAGNKEIQEQSAEKAEYSILWGLAESDGYVQKSKQIDARRDSLKALRRQHTKDTSEYNKKSYLWGAIQWTTKKEEK